MAVRTDFVAGEVLAAQDLDDTFAAKIDYATPVNTQTGTTYTFVLADGLRLTTASNASASTFTVPPQSSVVWLANSIIRLVNLGAGAVTINGGSGVTVTNTSATVAQFQSVDCIRTGSNAWTVVVAGGGDESGLVHINTTTVTAQSDVSINNVYSATNDNYLLIIECVSTADQGFDLVPRASGSNITTNLSSQRLIANGATVVAASQAATWTDRLAVDTSRTSISLTWCAPFLTQKSTWTALNVLSGQVRVASGLHNAATSYDGFTISVSSGNFTGTIRIYGYKNS